MRFIGFMASPAGRTLRILLGIVLVVAGYLVGGVAGVVLALVGIVPILAGALNFCLVAPLFGAPFTGARAVPGA